jgi:hypothetical protein
MTTAQVRAVVVSFVSDDCDDIRDTHLSLIIAVTSLIILSFQMCTCIEIQLVKLKLKIY